MSQAEDDPLSIEQALEQLRSELGGTLTDALQPILRINEQRGRPHQYLCLNPHETVQAYVLQVATHYEIDHDYLDRVQRQKDNETWETLLEKVRQWTYCFLNRWDLDRAMQTTCTLEITQEVGPEIMRAHYPYDCEFDAWACKITHHVCSKYMQRLGAYAVMDDIDLSEVDEGLRVSDKLSVPSPEADFAQKQSLLDAIAKLSENQKAVIWEFYFEGQPLPQIAANLGLSANAIYKRHFDALKQLRKILGINRHK